MCGGDVHGRGHAWHWGVHGRMGRGMRGRGHVWQGACVAGACMAGGVHGKGVCGRGACLAEGMHVRVGRGLCSRGVCIVGGVHGREGMCVEGGVTWHACPHPPPYPLADTMRYGQ